MLSPRLIILLALSFSASSMASAAPIGIDLTATVTIAHDPSGHLGDAVHVGDTITAKYVYDSATPGTYFDYANTSQYYYYGPPYGIVVRAGSLIFQTDPRNVDFLVSISNDWNNRDSYWLGSRNNLPLPGGSPVDRISWQLDDETGSAIDNLNLPLDAPLLSAWSSVDFGLTIESNFVSGGDDPFFVRAIVTSATLATDPYDPLLMPEPATMSLLAAGLSVLVLKRKARAW